ncbi:c-type cytochrome [Meridianimarinicoccus sp. RP-17]|uniref:c-type cytochrome n=1 Tax=Meridianimarinicoccus zhengii TaxID=2056810 RepID=UPI000DAC1D96|nr:c-type cytochrome [Phycocomes zhengii]
MTRLLAALAATALTAIPMAATAQSGDAAAGERAFRGCQACHVVVNDAGDTLAGRNAKTGPNLYQVSGRTAGSVDGFRYSGSMTEAGEAGLEWTEENFVAYVQDPTGFLQEYLDDGSARGSMSYKVRSEEDAADLYAYLSSLE